MNKFSEIIKKYNSYIILTHKNPDGDALGSAVALKNVLEQIGKDVDLYVQIPFLPSVSGLVSEDVVSDLDNLKPHYEACICVDCSSEDYLYGGDLRNICDKVIVIDHHKTNDKYGNINVVSEKAAASGELVFMLATKLVGNISKEVAELLYMAISTDTGNFAYSNTTPTTHVIASKLLKAGIDSASIYEMSKLKDIDSLLVTKQALENIYGFQNNKILVMVLDGKNIDGNTDTEGLIDSIRYIVGCKVAALVKRLDDSTYKVSLRTAAGNVDASAIAASYGGGGHEKAAGFNYEGTRNDVLSILKDIDLGE